MTQLNKIKQAAELGSVALVMGQLEYTLRRANLFDIIRCDGKVCRYDDYRAEYSIIEDNLDEFDEIPFLKLVDYGDEFEFVLDENYDARNWPDWLQRVLTESIYLELLMGSGVLSMNNKTRLERSIISLLEHEGLVYDDDFGILMFEQICY